MTSIASPFTAAATRLQSVTRGRRARQKRAAERLKLAADDPEEYARLTARNSGIMRMWSWHRKPTSPSKAVDTSLMARVSREADNKPAVVEKPVERASMTLFLLPGVNLDLQVRPNDSFMLDSKGGRRRSCLIRPGEFSMVGPPSAIDVLHTGMSQCGMDPQSIELTGQMSPLSEVTLPLKQTNGRT